VDKLLEFYRLQDTDSLYMFWLKEILVGLLIFVIFWLAAKIVRWLLLTLGPRFTSFTSSDLDDRILARITPPISQLVIFAGLYCAVRSLPLSPRAEVLVSGALFVITIIILTNIIWRALDELLKWYAVHLSERDSGGLDRQMLPLIEKLATIFLIVTALIITLKHFNYDILSLVTALGIGSLAIGMAAKDTLAHVISGFTIMLDRPFRISDRIQLKDGSIGDVITIGLRSTKIKTLDNTLLIIPNSDLCNSTLINLAFPDVRAKGKIVVGIDYASDVEKVKTMMVATALEVPEVLRDPLPEAYFTSFGDSSLNMVLFIWVEDYPKLFATIDKVNSRLLDTFRAAGVVIPFPTRTIISQKDEA
jgi:MscS family membrane protein